MPSKAYNFGTTEQTIVAEYTRTFLSIQNIHGTNNLFVSDQKGMALAEGQRISPNGILIIRRALGEEPQKDWHVVASGANTTARIQVDYADYPLVIANIGTPQLPPPPPPPVPERTPI